MDVENALVDAVDELRLVREVDVQLRPGGEAAFVVIELAGVDLLELMGDAAALDDLTQTGGDDVMLHVHAEVRAVGGDAREPLAHAGK